MHFILPTDIDLITQATGPKTKTKIRSNSTNLYVMKQEVNGEQYN